jgi:hypothetical protein
VWLFLATNSIPIPPLWPEALMIAFAIIYLLGANVGPDRGVCGLDAPSDLIFGGSPRHCGPAFPRYSFAALRHRRGSDDSSACAS